VSRSDRDRLLDILEAEARRSLPMSTSAAPLGSAVTAGSGANGSQTIKASISRSRLRSVSAGRVASHPMTAWSCVMVGSVGDPAPSQGAC